MKPLLHVEDGRIVPLEKVRTTHRAVLRLVDLADKAASATGAAAVELAVHHLGAHERAAELATLLDEQISPGVGLRRVRAGGGDRRAHRARRARRGGVPVRTVNPPALHRPPTIPRP